MPERDGKDQGEDNPKQVGSSWFARHSSLAISGTNLYAPGVWCAGVTSSFSGVVAFVLFCFVFFVFLLSLEPRPSVQSGKVTNPAHGQLNREDEYFPVLVHA